MGTVIILVLYMGIWNSENLSGLSQVSYLICSEADLNPDNLIAEPTFLPPP